MTDLSVLPRLAKSVQNGAGFSGKTGPDEKVSGHRESNWQGRRSRPCQKEQSRLSRLPDHEGEKVKVGESRTLARKRRIRAREWRRKSELHGEGR